MLPRGAEGEEEEGEEKKGEEGRREKLFCAAVVLSCALCALRCKICLFYSSSVSSSSSSSRRSSTSSSSSESALHLLPALLLPSSDEPLFAVASAGLVAAYVSFVLTFVGLQFFLYGTNKK